jgi:hypothetical protein
MQFPKTIRLTERKLGKEAALGLCWHGPVPHIELDPRQASKERLDTLCHELGHCLMPKMSEEDCIKFGQRMASVLWADGWRRIHK